MNLKPCSSDCKGHLAHKGYITESLIIASAERQVREAPDHAGILRASGEAWAALAELYKHAPAILLSARDRLKSAKERGIHARKSITGEKERRVPPFSKAERVCEWTEDIEDGSWDAECGGKWMLEFGTPADNHYNFCPGCGRHVEAEE